MHLRRRGHDDDRNVDSGHRAGTVQPDQRAAGDEGHGHESRVHRAGTAGDRDVSRPSSRASSRHRAATSCTRSRTPISPSRCCRTTTCCSSAPPDSSSVRSRSRTRSRIVRSSSAASMQPSTIQIVIARANTPTPSRHVADRIRYVGFGNINPQEYISYLDPVTYGHNSAAGAIGVAAYPFFAPFVPEAFTSPGPSTIYFDKNSQRLRHVEYRQKPDLAAMDGANTTFFTADSAVDDGHVPELLRNQRGGAACRGDCRARAGCRGRAGVGQTQEDARDPAGQRLRARPRSVLLVGLRRFREATCSRSTRPPIRTRSASSIRTCSPLRTSVDARWRTCRSTGPARNPTNSPGGIVFDERAAPLPAPGQPFVVGSHGRSDSARRHGHVLAARGSAGPRGAVEAARPHVPAGNVRRAVICCRSASIATKRTSQVRAALRAATPPTCSAAAC